MVSIENVKFNAVDAVKLSNGEVELTVIVGAGPRIVAFNRVGKENLFYVNESDYKNRSAAYKFYGGHRLWYSPEDATRSYLPDNSPCEVSFLKDGVVVSRLEEKTGIRRTMRIQLSDENRVRIIHSVKNESLFSVKIAPWAITQLRAGGVGVLPMITADAGYLSNRGISVWTYTKMYDKRIFWTDEYLHVSQTADEQPLKLGLLNDRGYMGYFTDGELFSKEFDLFDGEYPDRQVNAECYTNDKFIELETIGAFVEIPCGEEVAHTEVWGIQDGVEYKKDDGYLNDVFRKYTKC